MNFKLLLLTLILLITGCSVQPLEDYSGENNVRVRVPNYMSGELRILPNSPISCASSGVSGTPENARLASTSGYWWFTPFSLKLQDNKTVGMPEYPEMPKLYKEFIVDANGVLVFQYLYTGRSGHVTWKGIAISPEKGTDYEIKIDEKYTEAFLSAYKIKKK